MDTLMDEGEDHTSTDFASIAPVLYEAGKTRRYTARKGYAAQCSRI